jgi:hypothetical protein
MKYKPAYDPEGRLIPPGGQIFESLSPKEGKELALTYLEFSDQHSKKFYENYLEQLEFESYYQGKKQSSFNEDEIERHWREQNRVFKGE